MATQSDTDRKSNEERLQAVAAEIAAGLGLMVKAQDSEEWQNRGYVRMEGPAGESVGLSVNRFGAKYHGKVEIGGGTHRVNPDGKAYVSNTISAPSICVSLAKSAAEIVADIKRRFMPAYLAELDAHRKARAIYDEDRASEADRARRLGSVVGAPVRFGQGKAPKLDLYRSRDLPDNSTDVTIRSTGVRFEGLEVSDEVAAEILRILAREAAE